MVDFSSVSTTKLVQNYDKYVLNVQDGPKTDTQIYFWYKFGNSAPILTILSLLQA